MVVLTDGKQLLMIDRHLGLLGATITIFALAFDTFAQQVVVLRSMNVEGIVGASVGAVPRTERYSGYTKQVSINSKSLFTSPSAFGDFAVAMSVQTSLRHVCTAQSGRMKCRIATVFN